MMWNIGDGFEVFANILADFAVPQVAPWISWPFSKRKEADSPSILGSAKIASSHRHLGQGNDAFG